MVDMFNFKKNSLIILSIMIVLFFSLGAIHASDDFSSSSDAFISDSVMGDNDLLVNSSSVDSASSDDSIASSGGDGLMDDEVGDVFLRDNSNGEYDSYLVDIHDSNSDMYFSFISHLINDSVLNSSNKTFNLVVNKAQAHIIVSNYNTTYNSTENYTVQVLNTMTNRTIDSVVVCFKVHMASGYKEYNRTTDENGIARMDLSRLSLGTHDVQIFSRDSNVVFNTVSNDVVINKASTIVSAPSVSYKRGTNNYFRVTVRHQASNNLLAGLKITLKIYTGSSYSLYNVTTNANGVASFNTKNLAVGNHNVVISSANNDYQVTGNSSIQITN